jgi:hypothetical protein
MGVARTPAAAVMFLALTALAGAQRPRVDALLARLDHLVYATPDLDLGIDTIERLLGVRATPGGQHPGLGTRNALVSLGPSISRSARDRRRPSSPRSTARGAASSCASVSSP